MAHKWDYIGISLKQERLVSQLKGSPDLSDYQKLRRILFAWMKNGGRGVPVKCETLLRVLRSPSVELDTLAAKLEEVAIYRWQHYPAKPHMYVNTGVCNIFGSMYGNCTSSVAVQCRQ